MKLSTKSILFSGALLLGGTQTAVAGDWSLGVFAGQSKADGLDEVCSDIEFRLNLAAIFNPNRSRVTCSADDTDSALGLNIAYNFSETWGVELGYVDLGEYALTLSGLGGLADVTVDATAPYIAGVGTLPLSDKFSVSLRAGAFQASGDINAPGVSAVGVDGDTQAYAGASLDYRFTDAVSAQLRYDNFDEFDVASLGLKFHF